MMKGRLYFLLILMILVLVSGVISVTRRNIQRQVDNLESRYDNDYLYVKESLRDLWNTIDQLETDSQATEPPTALTPANNIPGAKSATRPQMALTPLLLGLSEEKTFLRKRLGDINDDIARLEKTFTHADRKKTNYLSEIEAKCRTSKNDVVQLQKMQSILLGRVERMDERVEAEIATLRMEINQAVEEVIQNSMLNRPSSCMDLRKYGVTASGVYTLHYKMQPFTVYCLLKHDGGYTFISPETYMNVKIEDLSNDNSHVIIRHRRTNGLQYESKIEQISRYKSRDLSIQYNTHTGYNGIVNSRKTPYIYVGLTPRNLGGGRSHKGDRQGYKSNGKDFTFINCDGNPNGYFAFVFDHNHVATSGKGESSAISRRWIDSSVRVTGDILPDTFLSFFELHFGGCGAYVGANHIREVSGAAVGIPFISNKSL